MRSGVLAWKCVFSVWNLSSFNREFFPTREKVFRTLLLLQAVFSYLGQQGFSVDS